MVMKMLGLLDFSRLSFFSKFKSFILSFLPSERRMNKAKIKMRNHPNAQYVGLSMDVSSMLRDSTFLINPFLIEHFSRPVIESFANMRPVIATNVEGMDEVVEHNINGILINKDDPISLARAINHLNANSDLISEMGLNGYKKAKAMFSPNNVLEIERVYELL